jgi:hypothetical protein
LNFSLQIEFSFPTGLSSYCQIFNLCILSSLINFSDHFLSTPASYYFFFFLISSGYIFIYVLLLLLLLLLLFILFYYLLLLFFCYYYIFFIFIFIFIFVWGPKNGLQQSLKPLPLSLVPKYTFYAKPHILIQYFSNQT